MSSINNMDLKSTARYFDQIGRSSQRLARIDYPNINKLNTSLQLTKKLFDQVQQKSKLLSGMQFTNIDILNEKLKRTEQQLSNIKSMDKKLSKLTLEVQVTVNSKVTTALESLINKLGSLPNSKANSSSEKSTEEKAIIAANYQKSNNDVYLAKMNAKKAGYEGFKAPLDAMKAPFDLAKAPLDLYNTIVKVKENRQAAKKKDTVIPPATSTTDAGDKTAGAGKTKIPKDFGRVKTIVEKPIIKCYPKVTVNCSCDHGVGSGSKKKGKSGKRNRSSSGSKSIRRGYSSGTRGYSPNPRRTSTGSQPKVVVSTSTPTPNPSSHARNSGRLGRGARLGIASGAGLLGLGGASLTGMPAMGEMASKVTDKLEGSKSGIMKGIGKGLLSGGSKLFAPLRIASSIASVARAKPGKRSGAIGSAVGGTAGAALGGVLGSVIPVVGTTIGAMAGGALGSYVGEKLGETKIAKDAIGAVSKGITGTFDYLSDKTKNIKEGFMSWFNGPTKPTTSPPPVVPAVNPAATLPAASIASAGAVNAAARPPAPAVAGKANPSGALQQVQLDPTQMKTISGYLTDLKAQVTNSIAVNVPAGAVQVTVHENEIDYDALVIQIGQRVVNELRKSMQNRKPTAPATTSAKPIMA
ncbi:hypothetical protein [Paenibacillus wenxiniae]|uniref:Uncharacterized protein n=1 Tax=Paenibacillus wenxiniae TaxID=1636843 RepID=A0ABW4RJC8_9BACL